MEEREKALAEFLHDLCCSKNHTDGCGWEWEDSKENKWNGTTHQVWLAKAKRLIKFLDKNCHFFFGVDGV